MPKKALPYLYFVTANGESAYRAEVRISKQQKALGQYTIAKAPQVFAPDGWRNSVRYSGPEATDSFRCGIDAGALVRVSLLKACAEIDANVVLFAPTQSSRIASKKA